MIPSDTAWERKLWVRETRVNERYCGIVDDMAISCGNEYQLKYHTSSRPSTGENEESPWSRRVPQKNESEKCSSRVPAPCSQLRKPTENRAGINWPFFRWPCNLAPGCWARARPTSQLRLRRPIALLLLRPSITQLRPDYLR